MLKPEERFGGFLEELFRYRVALKDQDDRVRLAGEAAVSAKKAANDRAYELLFSPDAQEEVLAQLKRLGVEHRPAAWRLRTEAQFLLTAVRGIYITSKALARTVGGKEGECVREAISSFDAAVPDPMLLRNVHEHFDAYALGEGRDQAKFPEPDAPSALAMTEQGVVVFLGGKLFHLGKLSEAATTLGDAVAECVRSLARD